MFKMNHAFVSFLCILFSNHADSQVNFCDTAKLKRSLERFVQLKLNNEVFPEDDTAKIYGVKDNEYWETDEKGAFKIHNNHDESVAYKSDTTATNFHRLQMKEIGLAYEINDMHIRGISKNMIIVNYKLVQHTVFNNEPCTKLISDRSR